MSSSQRQQVIMRDLVDEAKKRIVFLVICVTGLSYLMSLTSSSVWVNLPAAVSLIIMLRYFTLDYDMRRKASVYNKSKAECSSTNTLLQRKPLDYAKTVVKSDWRRKVNSPVVEDAVDKFTRHIVSEWVTDLWYSKLTPDKQGPEELVLIINGVIGELSTRVRNINLIDLLTRDLIDLICTHLELFRVSQAKVKEPCSLKTIEQRDKELRLVLATDNKLHPALFSAEAEHKVLQHMIDGLISFAFRAEDLNCSFFRYTARELLACAVIRPVLNLANPRFINERIEVFVLSKAAKGVVAQEASKSKSNASSRISSDHLSKFVDPTVTGVELVQMKNDEAKGKSVRPITDDVNGTQICKDPLLSMNTRSTRSWDSLPVDSQSRDGGSIIRHSSGGEWGEVLDMISSQKNATLSPDSLEDMWTKGKNYRVKGKDHATVQVPHTRKTTSQNSSNNIPKPREKEGTAKSDLCRIDNVNSLASTCSTIETQHAGQNTSKQSSIALYAGEDDGESSSSSSLTSEKEDISSMTGLDSPGTKVWDGKTNRSPVVSYIHHPLENPGAAKKNSKRHTKYQRLSRTHSGRKRSRTSNKGLNVWQEIERTSFLSGDGQDILSSKGHIKSDDPSENSDLESLSRVFSGTIASSSASSVPENLTPDNHSVRNSSTLDSFYKLRCEVLGANIVKSGSRAFAVYSIFVTDVNKNSWSIKRRFRHFEELHRRLKEYPEYSLHLPPKHFLSTGLEVAVILDRCKLLNEYLKDP